MSSTGSTDAPLVREALARLVRREDLDGDAMEAAVGSILDGNATQAQVGAFLAALTSKGETSAETVAAVRAMRSRAITIDAGPGLLDTCGTGGDGLGTFNVSTAASFVAAAGGLRVAKHGNRAASGKVGAADVLEALGARVDLEPASAAAVLDAAGITFLFAPAFHPALRHLGGPRRELGFRTLFNLLGPLCNPAGADHQLIGIFAPERLESVAATLRDLGTRRALVVHGSDGADELTPVGPASVVELRDAELSSYTIDPVALGVAACTSADLLGGDADRNAAIVREVLSGVPGPRADTVALNAGAALYVGAACETVRDGVERARQLMGDGSAAAKLDEFVETTQGAGR